MVCIRVGITGKSNRTSLTFWMNMLPTYLELDLMVISTYKIIHIYILFLQIWVNIQCSVQVDLYAAGWDGLLAVPYVAHESIGLKGAQHEHDKG
jgi:hypothetical protein